MSTLNNAEYKPSAPGADPELLARGADEQSTDVDYVREDREAAESDATGRVSKREADDLRATAGETAGGRTRGRGAKNDAYKQERQLDQALEQEGAI
ncbi:hypothetical protein DFH11DRAFT_1728515 [Phellopilus nigrolimitatus]|nr:hypothetical protein DFH11DRAFT_1728515 [Phellopilus nigrolimitatus]